MAYSIKYDQQTNIVYTTCLQKEVSIEDRARVIEELGRMSLPRGVTLLADNRKLRRMITGEESKQLLELSEPIRLKFHKFAILHREDFPTHTLLSSDATLEGVNMAEFSSLEAAEAWLKP